MPNHGRYRDQITALLDALQSQQIALLCHDGDALMEATTILESKLSVLESAKKYITRNDAEALVHARSIAQVNHWLLRLWESWIQEVAAFLRQQDTDSMEAAC